MKKQNRRIRLIGGAVFAVVAIAIVAVIFNMTHASEQAAKAYWKPQGPPCPALSHAAFVAAGYGALNQSSTYDDDYLPAIGVRSMRAAGEVYCSHVEEGPFWATRRFTVCQFSNPIALNVTVRGRDYDYVLGVAKPATITVTKDSVSCVAAGNFQ